VCSQQQNGLKLMGCNVFLDGFAFFGEPGAAVNDDSFARRVAYNIGVFLDGIADKAFNFKHCCNVIMIA
jgi:hypothetical protein